MHTSIRELKTHLSHYIHQVQAGIELTVTLHNQPVAKIIPIAQEQTQLSNRKELIAELTALLSTLPQQRSPLSKLIIKQRQDERY